MNRFAADPTFSRNRRSVLRESCAGFGYLALQGLLGGESAHAGVIDPLAAKRPHFPARAKRVIFLLMKGGPSQVDTFDPKPLLDRDHGKPPPFDLPRVKFAQRVICSNRLGNSASMARADCR